MRALLIAALVAAPMVTAPVAVQAQPTGDPAVCAALTAQVEALQKELAVASRVRTRWDEASFIVLRAQTALQQMTANRCSPYPHPISPDRYIQAATACGDAIASTRSSTVLPACVRENWAPRE